MKKQILRITENELRSIITESVNRIIKESLSDYYDFNHLSDENNVDDENYQYMSDADIEQKYKDFDVTHINVQRANNGEGYNGTIEITFPNADDEQFDSTMVDNFFIYDNEMTRFGFDNWYPQEITEELKEFIKEYIKQNNI